MPISKFVTVAVEGSTTDGRELSRTDLAQMANNYDPKKYGARIWLEHLRGYMPESSFRAYGDVIALKGNEVVIDGNKKFALQAQLDVTDDLVAMNQQRQKIYTSIEMQPNFAKTGEAYLVGLGVTDSPASLGTEALKFHAHKKQQDENLMSAAVEVSLEFETEETESPNLGTKLFNKVKELLGSKDKTDQDNFNGISQAVEAVATSQQNLLAQFSAQQTENKTALETIESLKAELKTTSDAFNAFKDQMDAQPNTSQEKRRPAATGGNGQVATDC